MADTTPTPDPLLPVLEKHPLPWNISHLFPDKLPIIVDSAGQTVMDFSGSRIGDMEPFYGSYPDDDALAAFLVGAVNERYSPGDPEGGRMTPSYVADEAAIRDLGWSLEYEAYIGWHQYVAMNGPSEWITVRDDALVGRGVLSLRIRMQVENWYAAATPVTGGTAQ